MSGLGQGCDVIVTSCCRCNISEAEAGELKQFKSVWAREDSTGALCYLLIPNSEIAMLSALLTGAKYLIRNSQ